MTRSGQGSGVREIRSRRLTRRGLETGSRRTYTGTKLETAETAKGSLRGTAPVLDPTVGTEVTHDTHDLLLSVLTDKRAGAFIRTYVGSV